MDCQTMQWIVNKEVMPLYIETAKTFASLSSGALALTIVFYEKIVGVKPGRRVNQAMVTSWFLYLLTIATSALYQYLAVRFLDSVSCAPAVIIEYFKPLISSPGIVYGAMLFFFFAASTLLLIAAWRQLPTRSG